MVISRMTSLSIKYNGKNITTKLNQYLEKFQYTDVASGKADTLDLTLSDTDHKWIDTWFPAEGDYIESTMHVHNWLKAGDDRNLKCGKFFVDEFSYSGPTDITTIGAISKPVDSDFSTTEHNKSWKNVTLEGIAQNIAKSAGVTLIYDAPTYKISKLEQSGQTDMNFLFDLCSKYSLAMKLYNSKIVIFDEIVYEKKRALYTIDKVQCSSYEPHATLSGMYDGVQISYTDSDTNKTLKYKYLLRDSGKRLLNINEKSDSYADAEILAKSKLRASNKAAMTLKLTLMGDVKYLAATCVNITGFGKFNGKYYIDEVVHDLSDGYKCTISMHKTMNIAVYTAQSSNSNKKFTADESYYVVANMVGYYTAAEALNNASAGNVTGKVNKGKYFIYLYHEATGMINVTKVSKVAGAWIDPARNK